MLEKQWPAAQQCGTLFDRLRKGALTSFREDSPDLAPSLEAEQLRGLVFRENADLLFAHEQPTTLNDEPAFETMLPEFDIDYSTLEYDTDILGFFNFAEIPDVDGNIAAFDQPGIQDSTEQPSFLDTFDLNQQSDNVMSEQRLGTTPDEARLKKVMKNLPVCSHCRKRRIKCDMDLPACRNCVKLGRDCCYWDNALDEETSRTYVMNCEEYGLTIGN